MNPFNKSKYPNCYRGHQYALDVIDKKIVACKYIISACERYLRDLNNEEAYFYFNTEKAERYLRVVQKFQHVKGTWKTKNIFYEPWQCWQFMNIIGFRVKETDFPRFRIAHLEESRGNGKAHTLDTIVPTPEGFKKWQEIEVGSRLYSRDGSTCTVTNKTQITEQVVYEVHFSDGSIIKCSGEHEWITSNKAERSRKRKYSQNINAPKRRNKYGEIIANTKFESVKETKEILKTINPTYCSEFQHRIENCAPIRSNKRIKYAYYLGYWLGNGNSLSPIVSCHINDCSEILKLFKKIGIKSPGTRKDNGNGAVIKIVGMTKFLNDNNLLGNKHFKEEWIFSCEEDRLELLRGLMDSDGYATKNNDSCTFYNSNISLIKGVAGLAASLGFKPVIRENKIPENNNFKTKIKHYEVQFCPRGELKVFNLPRKRSLITSKRGNHNYSGGRYIKKILKTERKEPMFCVEVDSKDHTYLVGKNFIPTHNSAKASGAVLFFVALDENINGNMVSCVATKTEQARIVLDDARNMAKKNTSFLESNGVKVLAHKIVHEQSNSIARALSADYGGMDGLNDVLAVCDELHAMNRQTFEVITSGMSKRKDSLLLCITTAGSDTNSIGYFQSVYAKKVATGEVQDDTFFAAVFTLDEDDYWADESVWIKANPNLGVSVDTDSLRAKVEKALVSPSDIPNLKIKHFNLWISEANAFFDLKAWDKCEDKSLKLENFLGKPLRMGLDLASHIDIASIAYVFKEDGIFYIFDKSFLPEETVKQKKNPFYENCIADGSLIQTPGSAISYDNIKSHFLDARRDFRVQEVYFDVWNANQLAQDLSDDLEFVKFAMNTANFSEPMKKLDVLIKEKKIRHNGSSLLRWCLGNVVAKEDHNGNVFPRKSHEKMKIDPIVAILMALAGHLSNPESDSVYDERGILTL